jgi:hypothetical protein
VILETARSTTRSQRAIAQGPHMIAFSSGVTLHAPAGLVIVAVPSMTASQRRTGRRDVCTAPPRSGRAPAGSGPGARTYPVSNHDWATPAVPPPRRPRFPPGSGVVRRWAGPGRLTPLPIVRAVDARSRCAGGRSPRPNPGGSSRLPGSPPGTRSRWPGGGQIRVAGDFAPVSEQRPGRG